MISSCCTFRLNRRSALSMDSPSCTFTSAKLVYTPLAADRIARRSDAGVGGSALDHLFDHWSGRLDPSEYARLSQVHADSGLKAEPSQRGHNPRTHIYPWVVCES